MAELLIAAKADLNIQNQDCRAALIVAIRYGNTDMAKLLIAAGADINSQDRWGGTALMMAALVGRTESVELLIKAGADLNIQDEYGDTALIKAVRYGKTAIVKLLIAAGADLNILDKKGETVWNLSTVTNFLGESHTLLTVTIQSCVEAHLDWLNIEDQALSSENIAQAVRELLFLEKRLLQSDNAQAWSRLEQRFGKRQIDNQLEDKYTQAELEMAKDIYPSVLNALLENVNQETHANDYSPLFTKDELEKLTGRED
ncbi:MAG TPA: hypothetical protein DHV51_00200 [Opitutae bacterium]|nr:hypothetical protein [Opitutae bacterium]